MTTFLEMRQVRKSYNGRSVLNGIDLALERGEVVGIIGPNGAGKTTLLSVLAGLLSWNAGTVLLASQPLENVIGGPKHPLISISSSQFGAFDYLTGRESIVAHGRMQAPTDGKVNTRAEELLTLFDLDGAGDLYVYEYSYGMKKKLSLACALVGVPDLLLLDEPFDGLDSVSVLRLIEVLRQTAKAGGAVLLTSHDLNLVEKVCERAYVLHEGVLQTEIKLAGLSEYAEATQQSNLQSALWNVVGVPHIQRLSWLR